MLDDLDPGALDRWGDFYELEPNTPTMLMLVGAQLCAMLANTQRTKAEQPVWGIADFVHQIPAYLRETADAERAERRAEREHTPEQVAQARETYYDSLFRGVKVIDLTKGN